MINSVEQDHLFLKRRVNPSLGLFSSPTAWRTIHEYETMHMIRKEKSRERAKELSMHKISSSPDCLV
jgi:transposase-like protein